MAIKTAYSGCAFHYKYQARIHTCKSFWRKLPRWRFEIQEYFMAWRYYYTSRKYKSEHEAKCAAEDWLNAKNRRPDEEDSFVKYVEEPPNET